MSSLLKIVCTLPLCLFMILAVFQDICFSQAQIPDEYIKPSPPEKPKVQAKSKPSAQTTSPKEAATAQPVQAAPTAVQPPASETPKIEPASPASSQSLVAGGTVEGIKFFAGGAKAPSKSDREYKDVFNSGNTKYIYWELILKYPSPIQKYNLFDLKISCYNENGRKVYEHTHQAKQEVGWVSSTHFSSWGRDTTGWWAYGNYILKIHYDGREIASGKFRVY